MPNTRLRTYTRALYAAQVAAALLLACVFGLMIFFRLINLDEGWYLAAAKLVYEGRIPYHDFAYTQTPLLPYVYGAPLQIAGVGLYQGRAITVGFALLAVLCCLRTAQVRGGIWAGVLTVFLLATSLHVIAYYSYTAAYALSGAFMATAVWLTAWRNVQGRDVVLHAAAIGALLALGSATRMSILAIVPLFFLFLIWRRTDERFRTALAFGGGFLVVAGLVIGPFLLRNPDTMIYYIFGFHVDRILHWEWHLLKVQRILGETGWDLLGIVALNGALAAGWTARRAQCNDWQAAIERDSLEGLIALSALALLLVQLVPSTTISHYNTLQAPLLCITGAVGLVRVGRRLARHGMFNGPGETDLSRGRAPRMLYQPWGWIGLLLLAHLLHQIGILMRHDLLNWPLTNQIAVLHRTVDSLRPYIPHDGTILSFNTHLILEAGLDPPPGYEMSIFSYRPTWETSHALAYKAINNELLMNDLRAGAHVVALSDFDVDLLYGDRDAVLHTLYEHYRLWRSVPGLGPLRGRLHFYLPPQIAAVSPTELHTYFDNGIMLLNAEVEFDLHGDPKSVDIGLYWHTANGLPAVDYIFFVHLVDSTGALLAGWDNRPCRGTCPTRVWLAGETLRDEYTLALTPEILEQMASGSLQLLTGIYEETTGVPVSARGAGVRTEDHRVYLMDLSLPTDQPAMW